MCNNSQSNYFSAIQCNNLSIKLLVHYLSSQSFIHTTCPLLSFNQTACPLSLSIKLLVHYQVQLSFNQTTCPLSSAFFQSNYLFTIKCNFLSIKLLVHYQVQLSFNQTACPLSCATILSQTTFPLSNVTIFQSNYLSSIQCNYLSFKLLVLYPM